MLYVTAIHLSVPVPALAGQFLCDVLGFEHQPQDDGSCLVNNDAIMLVLHVGNASPVELNLHTTDMAVDAARLLALPHVVAIDETMQQQGRLCWQRFDADCGLRLRLCRTLDEDEMAILPPLPSNLPWDDAVDLCVRRVLRIVPVDFRDKARHRVTERAEFLCLAAGSLLVSEAFAVQALKDSTLDFQQRELYETLQQQGVTMAHYFTEKPQ